MKKGIYILATLALLWSVFPFYWTGVTSLRTGSELYSPSLIPAKVTLQNYSDLGNEQGFITSVFNSILVAGNTVVLATLLSLLAAYPLSRKEFFGRRGILFLFLFGSMFPQITVLAGLFELIRALGLFDRKAGLVVSYFIFALPFNVWILTSFMKQIPKSIEEAAFLDGAGSFSLIFRIFAPIMGPSLVSSLLLTFMLSWNEFLFALTFAPAQSARTAPVAIAMMSGASEHEIPWGKIMAASVLVTAPVLVLVFLFQKRMISGLTAGSVKT